ncbi:hypothetical protein [Streptomyces caelestis]|uniref:hypothetical protein n=1 Tax=Streptomyces caelestis TaxID=36816 RepID=UPI0036550FB2
MVSLGLRALVLVAAIWVLVRCWSSVEEQHRATVVYRSAPVCAAGQASGDPSRPCVEQSAARVVGKTSYQSCNGDGNNGVWCVDQYVVTVRHARGTGAVPAKSPMYRAVREGDPVTVRLWGDAVVRMEAHGRTETYDSPAELSLLRELCLACIALGVAMVVLVPRLLPPFLMGAAPLLAVPAVGITNGLLVGSLAVWQWILFVAMGVAGLVVLIVLFDED